MADRTYPPKVSLGLPVYNGEAFLVETLASLLVQTFTDFELIISDNASTDRTEMICREYAAADPRVIYHRNQSNIGAAANYNRTFELARGEYFKWAAHDDLIAPTYLERCVEVLDRDPSVVLAYTRGKAINDNGEVIKVMSGKRFYDSPEPRLRFHEFVLDRNPVLAVFGVIRREVLAQTRLIGGYAGSDRPLLSELSLRGKFYEVPEYLFFYRFHESQSWGGKKSRRAQVAWYDPRRAGKKSYPDWRLLQEHMRSIGRAPIDAQERLYCYLYLGHWIRRNWRGLGRELLLRDA